jgi:hypothetical protein
MYTITYEDMQRYVVYLADNMIFPNQAETPWYGSFFHLFWLNWSPNKEKREIRTPKMISGWVRVIF